MRLILGPVLSLVLLIASLGLLANAYVDHDEFIARSAVDDLSTRGESLAVPFQHSLREFLEGAADVYQRSLDEYEDGILERGRTRNDREPPRMATVEIHYKDQGRLGQSYVSVHTTLLETIPREILWARLHVRPEDLNIYVNKPAPLRGPLSPDNTLLHNFYFEQHVILSLWPKNGPQPGAIAAGPTAQKPAPARS
ncbi:hypothetical protein D9611_010724 [Ephemerocybe angulata]|uniref:Uncharacterized protein n=1 Tax=Ephemerocybe angulata TaxID=980116 RepID=A0A8H5F1L4_9AGAR|nr:hypothetical protein D9611_010724 [Tulosesus angulatus]